MTDFDIFKSLGKLTQNQPIFTPGAESPVSAIGWWHPKGYAFFSESPYDFYHYSLKSRRIFKTTTRAYKRTQNSIFSSRIASPFKKRNVTPPTDNSEDCTPRRTQPTILISRLLRMRINEVKMRSRGRGEEVAF